MNKKNIFYWAMYDFANSIPVIVFALYFSQWLVVENGVSDILFNLTFVISSLLLISSAPILGVISDQKGVKLPYLRNLTLAMIVTILITTLLTLIFPAKSEFLILAAIFFTLTNYFYQFSLVFYSALLPQLAPINKRGFISGLGISAGWLGQILGLLITLPFASGKIYLFGNPGREQTFLPAVILYILLTLPMVFLFKEKVTVKKTAVKIIEEYKNYIKNFKLLIAEKGLGRFLLGYFFFTDAVLTVQNNFAIYLEQVFKIND